MPAISCVTPLVSGTDYQVNVDSDVHLGVVKV